jgi:hypothetical protein
MKSFTLFVALAVAALAVSVNAHNNRPISGVFRQEQTLYRLHPSPVDPSNVEITFDGNWKDGTITIHMNDPNTTCTIWNNTNICGNRAFDATIVIGSDHGNLYLISHVDHINPQNTGIMEDLTVSGYWAKDGLVNALLGYILSAYNKGPATNYASVGIKMNYVGTYNKKHNVFDGFAYTRATAYIFVAGVGRTTPYQTVGVPMFPITSLGSTMTIPHRAVSPYAATPLAPTPVAPYDVTGSLSNVDLSNEHILTANVHLVTPNDGLTLNFDGTLLANYYRDSNVENLYHVSYGKVVASNGDEYIIENSSFIVPLE